MRDHAHDHGGGHDHLPKNERAIGIAAILTGTFMLAEVAGGLISGSLALLADAGHMLTDFASLMLAWLAFRLARRPADAARTYGYDRFSVLAAFVNGMTLFVIAAWICWEAVQRLREPVEVMGGLMLGVAVAGLLVNIAAFYVLTRDESENLNVRAAALHVAGDLLGSVAAIVASLVILWTGWMPIDPILSVLVALIILRSAWAVVRESGHILLEGAPRGFDQEEVVRALREDVAGVTGIEHLHAWQVTQERPMVTLEVETEAGCDRDRVRDEVKALLNERFGLGHATVEIR
ncbi:cation diffusion facilitator family transporter [Roseovarius sp. SCSIO 43702]|uniref:cation diffusion facilitator family transporter n=1 Tax=Roseovarius sp. SCSIO 43702 TaxID=2823043 RepID=UPI001C73796D|nr:cation diffusion facilitator family transporter [Roseovarius sp. SCSIO 43702]QYX58413.1 cation diffusion facilitator family transporter [Roseovarius sp. SCSIO 43702]